MKQKSENMEMDKETLVKKLNIDLYSDFVNGKIPDFPFFYGKYYIVPKEKDGKKVYDVYEVKV